jgi:RNA polymerase sigma-B factor
LYLQPRDEESLLDRYHAQHDVEARDELVQRYLPLVRSLAKRYSYTSEPLDDLCQVGAIALCKAIDRYRPGCGASFKAYAVPTIVGELRRHFRDTGWALHMPRSLQELARTVGVAVNALATQNARSPTIAEIAAFSGLSREQVIEGLEVRMAYDAASLDAGRSSEEEPAWLARLGEDDAGFETVEQQALLERAMRALPERERELLHLRFSEDLSQSDIAKRVGVSQMHVSRMLRRAVARLQAVTDAESSAREPGRFGAVSAG